MANGEKIHNLIRTAALVATLVVVQQITARAFFGPMFDGSAVPQLILVNFGIVAGWQYFKDPARKLPMFAIVIAAFCLAIWLRAVLVYVGVLRLVAPVVIAFLERQFAFIVAFVSMPQFIPAMFAAVLLLLLLPKARGAYSKLVSNGFFIF